MKRTFAFLALAGAFACSALAQPVVTMVLNKASYSAAVSPGCWVIVLGYNLAAVPMSVPPDSLVPALGGTSLTVAGITAQLLSVSPDEIDALIPSEVAIPPNTVVTLAVTSGAGKGMYNIRLTRNAPAIVTRNDGSGRALVYDSNMQEVDTVGPQDSVILRAVGLGPTDDSGKVVDEVEVYIGDRKAEVTSAGLAPGLPGIYQLSVTASSPATGRVYLRTGGWQSNIAAIGIRSGMNTANVTGTIDGLNPSNDPIYPKTPQRPCLGDNDPGPCGPTGASESFSVILHAGTFAVSFDIVPGAGPFAVAAVGEAGGTIISVDPAARTYTASVVTLPIAAGFGDFSGSVTRLWDYLSCDWKSALCQQFPASSLPVNRMPPWLLRAMQQLPAPNTVAGASAFVQASGNLDGARFAVDGQSNSGLSVFGGTVQVPYGPFELGISRFSLYVDGRLIAVKDLPYLPAQRAPARIGPDDF